MICITRILAFQDIRQRLDMAAEVLLHAARRLRMRHADAHHDASSDYRVDMATATNLTILAREVYEDSTDRVIMQ